MSIHSTSILQKKFLDLLSNSEPSAYAQIIGDNSELHGMALFYNVPFGGILTEVEVFGLPNMNLADSKNFYGMHIHENGDCTPPFSNTGNHYNPDNLPHPRHAGDLPPLVGCEGYAYSVFYIVGFNVNNILNRSLIIHSMPDDFTTQPSGNSGEKIGCGVILPYHPS